MPKDCETEKRKINREIVEEITRSHPEEPGIALEIADRVLQKIAGRCEICRTGRETKEELGEMEENLR